MESLSSYVALWSTILVLVAIFGCHGEVTGQCLEHQRSLIEKLYQSLELRSFDGPLEWDSSKDCCGWPGVTCNDNGHIIGLDLTNDGKYFPRNWLNNSSPLFHLEHLTTLNFAGGAFHLSTHMSSGFERLVNLMNLYLNYASFLERFPAEISNLTRLEILGLSWSRYDHGSVNYMGLIGNLSKLTQLHLDNVNYMRLGMHGSEWSKFMPSSFPHLQVLSLSQCGLSGLLDASFQNLTLLSNLDLSFNDLGIPFPTFISEFKYLSTLRLAHCKLEGYIPSSFTKLTSLTHLDLSANSLSGPIPSFSRAINLTILDFSLNLLTGSILDTKWGHLSRLERLEIQGNYLTGSIPSSLFGIPALLWLDVFDNHFVNFTDELVSTSSSQLIKLVLSYNDLQGSFPSIIYSLHALEVLMLKFNNLSGTFYMDSLQKLRNLRALIISYNKFFVEFGEDSRNYPILSVIGMASCKLKAFPQFLQRYNKILLLDLSANQIQGEIPLWIWGTLGSRGVLNFSHNHLESFEIQMDDPQYCDATTIDLSYNNLHGNIPIFRALEHIDLSENSFDSTVFSCINISAITFLRISNNILRGSIPKSLCNGRLSTLDMSGNFLTGTIPSCLLQNTQLKHLCLMNNTIGGTIPDSLPSNCYLLTAFLNGNLLEGTIPKSFGNCTSLKFLDLGDNKLHGSFPCWMSIISGLAALILKSNMFQGSIVCPGVNVTWPRLQILDISSNKLSGNLPSGQLLNWERMLVNDSSSQDYFTQESTETSIFDIQVSPTIKREMTLHFATMGYTSVMIVLKGTKLAIPKVSTSFTLIDLSDNMFEGTIPEELGYLIGLHQLNISHNKLGGQIPSSLGRMQNLESLDLRNNELSGNIPMELADLKSLSVLNLSFNRLEGKIPSGNQLQTFSEYSFLHNEDLCGPPLDISCAKTEETTPLTKPSSVSSPSSIFEGEILIFSEVGFVLGLGMIIMPLIFWAEWRKRFYEFTERKLLKMLCR